MQVMQGIQKPKEVWPHVSRVDYRYYPSISLLPAALSWEDLEVHVSDPTEAEPYLTTAQAEARHANVMLHTHSAPKSSVAPEHTFESTWTGCLRHCRVSGPKA